MVLVSKPYVSRSAHNLVYMDPVHVALKVYYNSMLPRSPAPQIILFSATFPDNVRTFANKFAPKANKIELQKEELSVDNIRQLYLDCKDEEHKYDILVLLYHVLTIGQSIIFCQVSVLAVLLYSYTPFLINVDCIHSTGTPQTVSPRK